MYRFQLWIIPSVLRICAFYMTPLRRVCAPLPIPLLVTDSDLFGLTHALAVRPWHLAHTGVVLCT